MRPCAAMLFAALIVAAAPAAARAATPVPAIDISTADCLGATSARDVNAAGRIYLQCPPAWDGLPGGLILLPPQPGGGVLELPCSGFNCFHETELATGLNAGGRVLGRHIYFGSGGPFLGVLASWDPSGTTTTLLAALPGGITHLGTARHLNSSDVIVGTLKDGPGPGIDAPVFWSSPTATPALLANLGTSEGPYPVRISDGGAIIGDRSGATPRAVLWPSTAAAYAYLGELLGGATSHARDLDESGHVVGSSDAGGGTQVAVLWRPLAGGYTVKALPLPFAGGSCQVATAIEPGGWIAGNCTNAAGDRRGVIWRSSVGLVAVAYELLPLSGDTHSAVYALSGNSLAAGSSGDPERAVIWNLPAAEPLPVPALGLPGLVLLAASLAAGALRASRRRR